MLQALATIVTSLAMATTSSRAVATHLAADAATRANAAQFAASDQPSEATEEPPFAFHEIETQLIEATNHARAERGLPPLAVDYDLMRSARRHAAWMTRSRLLQHTTAMVAENIAMGQESVQEAMHSWMTSPGHRANILSGSYRRIGVAAYRTPEGTIYWCQQFLY